MPDKVQLEERHSYKSILKAISLFGGLKVFQIIIGVIKNKFVAILLGPTGMGVVGMITSTTGMVSALTSFGLETSSVRDVAQAYTSKETDRVNRIITVLRKLILWTGLLGMVITFLFSSYLSKWAFGNEEYNGAFKLVSVTLLMIQLSIGQNVLLQGTFHYKYMARASLIGSVLGLITTVPLYYFFGFKAIVPVIIITAFFTLMLTWYFSQKIPFTKVKMSLRETIFGSKNMLILGSTVALVGLINTGHNYFLRLVISNYGSISDVGLYTAGMTIATSYIGIVFTAMGTDYAPRLASVANDKEMLNQTINRQALLLTIILAPMVITFIVFIKQLTILLYSSKFIDIIPMIQWMMFAMLFRAISWSISFSFVAANKPGMFMVNELISAIYSIVFSIAGYILLGFLGMGIAFFLTYSIYTIHMYLLARKAYKFRFNADFKNNAITTVAIVTLFFVLLLIIDNQIIYYTAGVLFIIMTMIYSFKKLNQLMGFSLSLQAVKKRIKNK